MPRQTNADRILIDARQRLAIAEQDERDADTRLRIASAAVAAHRANLNALEAVWGPKAKKKTDPAPAAEQKETKITKVKKCDVCYEDKDYPVHDKSMGYADYHEFVTPGSGKKRKPKDDPQIAIVKDENTSALAVGAD